MKFIIKNLIKIFFLIFKFLLVFVRFVENDKINRINYQYNNLIMVCFSVNFSKYCILNLDNKKKCRYFTPLKQRKNNLNNLVLYGNECFRTSSCSKKEGRA